MTPTDPSDYEPTLDLPEGNGFRLFKGEGVVRFEIVSAGEPVYAVNIPNEHFHAAFFAFLERSQKLQ